MRTKLFAACIIALSVVACKKEIKLEVKQIHETESSNQWNIKINRPAFSSTEAEVEKSCVKFNDEITGLVNGIHAAFIEQAKETLNGLDSIGVRQAAPYELLIRDSVFLADENYISVLVSSYEMLGGANGITSFYGVNYNVKNQKFLDKKDILNYDKASEINALLKENLKDPDKCYTFEVPTVENFTAVNFTLNTVEFTYAKYILGPGSCGPVTISVPRHKLEGMVKI